MGSDTAYQYESAYNREPTISQTHLVAVVPNKSSADSLSYIDNDHDKLQESSEGGSESGASPLPQV